MTVVAFSMQLMSLSFLHLCVKHRFDLTFLFPQHLDTDSFLLRDVAHRETKQSPFTYLKRIRPVSFLFATRCYNYVKKITIVIIAVDDKREKIMSVHHKQLFIVSFEKSRVCMDANWIMPEWGISIDQCFYLIFIFPIFQSINVQVMLQKWLHWFWLLERSKIC